MGINNMKITHDRNGHEIVHVDDSGLLGQTFLLTHDNRVLYGTVNDVVLTNVGNDNGNLVVLTVSIGGADDYYTMGEFVQARVDAEHRAYVAEVNETGLEEA